MCCRGVQRLANPAYLEGFPFPALLRVAPYCVLGGIRVVSGARVLRNSPTRKKASAACLFLPLQGVGYGLLESHRAALSPRLLPRFLSHARAPCPSAQQKFERQPQRGSRYLLERPLFRVRHALPPTAALPAPFLRVIQ